ncbi:unnamed protein product [Umbelopsis ramanniana]
MTPSLARYGLKLTIETPYHPHRTGQVERTVQTVRGVINKIAVSVLAKLANQDQNVAGWDDYLEPALLAIRTMLNESTGSPQQIALYQANTIVTSYLNSIMNGFEQGFLQTEIKSRVAEQVHSPARQFKMTIAQRPINASNIPAGMQDTFLNVELAVNSYQDGYSFAKNSIYYDAKAHPENHLVAYNKMSQCPPRDYVEGEYADALLGRLQVIDSVMREFWTTSRQRDENRRLLAKRRYDETVIPMSFTVGYLKLMRDHYAAQKLDNKWIGPLTVVRTNANDTYHLTGPFGRRIEGALVGDQLRPWHSRGAMRSDVPVKSKTNYFLS